MVTVGANGNSGLRRMVKRKILKSSALKNLT